MSFRSPLAAEALNEHLIFAHIDQKNVFNRQVEDNWLIDITDFIYISIIGLCKAWSNCSSTNEKYFTVNIAAEELYLNNFIKVYPPDERLSLE